MAVLRQQNWLAQQRVDIPHLRSIESGVAADFDALAGVMLAGKVPLIVSGFDLTVIDGAAEMIEMRVSGGALIHYEGAVSGSILYVPETRPNEVLGPSNPNVRGSFSPNATNFVGLDLARIADDSTADSVRFLDATTNQEGGAVVPTGKTMRYVIVVSTADFSSTPGICPIARVSTDAANAVISVTDARNMAFGLQANYGWPKGRGIGGDTGIDSLKAWCNAMMSRCWELGGGEYWYSPTSDRNVVLTFGSTFASTGEPFEVVGGHVRWQGLRFHLDNSTATINEISDQITSVVGYTDLADGQCLYVDLDRTTNRTVLASNALQLKKGVLSSLGQSAKPGGRYAVVWRVNGNYYTRGQYLPLGSGIRPATVAANGSVRLSATPASSIAPIAATISGPSGLIAGVQGVSRRGTGTSGDLQLGLGLVNGDVNVAIQDKIYVDALGGIGLTTSTKNTAPSAPLVAKICSRPSRYWLSSVNAVAGALPAYTESGSGSTKTLTASAVGGLVIDGVSLVAGNRVLVTGEITRNGIYTVANAGSGGTPWVLTRASDMDSNAEMFLSQAVKVLSGTLHGGSAWYIQTILDGVNLTDLKNSGIIEVDTPYWGQTSTQTHDLITVLWPDGSETVIAQGPARFV